LARRSTEKTLPLYYMGPDKDLAVIEGLAICRTGVSEAALVLCTGLVDDLTETPEDYADRLAAMRERNLTMLCANPDLVVHRGAQLCYCAGALAQDYEKLGGEVTYYGKPHLPIYDAALAAAGRVAEAANKPNPKKPLAVGDGLFTDILGAGRAGLDALFIADGVHGEEVEPYGAEHLGRLFAKSGVTALAASRSLTW
jgi:HAD superfamily hydrolase (TIGR01459 family)